LVNFSGCACFVVREPEFLRGLNKTATGTSRCKRLKSLQRKEKCRAGQREEISKQKVKRKVAKAQRRKESESEKPP